MDIYNKMEKVRHYLRFDFIKVAFIETEIEHMKYQPVYALGNRSDKYMRIVLQKRIGLAGLVIKTGRSHYIRNVAEEISPENRLRYPIILAEGLKSLGAVPIFHQHEVVGVVLAGYRTVNKMTESTIAEFENIVKREFGGTFSKERI